MLQENDELLKDLENTLTLGEQELLLLKNQVTLSKLNGIFKGMLNTFLLEEKWFSLIEVGITELELNQ
jgi:hypothetical protein